MLPFSIGKMQMNTITTSDLGVLISAHRNHGYTKSFSTSSEGIDKLRRMKLLQPKDNGRIGELTTPKGSAVVELALEVAQEFIEDDIWHVPK